MLKLYAGLAALLSMIVAGCATYANAAALQEMLERQPLQFTVGRDSVDVVWSRASRWFEEFGRPKVETKTNNLIRSEFTNVPNGKYRLQVERAAASGDSTTFILSHDWQAGLAAREEDRERALRILREYAYTVRTGDTPSAWLARHP